MTITNTTKKTELVGTNQVSQTMVTTFDYNLDSDLLIEESVVATGVVIGTKVLNVDYTATSPGGGLGTVTTVFAVPTTNSWTMKNDAPQKQTVDYTPSGLFPANSHEGILDGIVRMVLSIQEQLNRSLKFPLSDDASISSELPSFPDRISRYLGIAATGEVVPLSAPTDTALTTTYIETLLDDDNALEARTTLDAQQDLDSALTLVEGDILVANSTPAVANLAVGAVGNWLRSDGTNPGYKDPELFQGDFRLTPFGYISGCELSIGADTDHDIDISAGWVMDSTNSQSMRTSGITKLITGDWSEGNDNSGFPDTGLDLTNGETYHAFIIGKTDGSTDAGFDTSLTATNLLDGNTAGASGYTLFRRIGSFYVDGSANLVPFTQNGDVFMLDTPVPDVIALAISVTTEISHALASVPKGIKSEAIVSIGTTLSGVLHSVYGGGDDTLPVPSATLRDAVTTSGSDHTNWHGRLRTSTTRVIKSRHDVSSGNIDILTKGWVDRRGI